jgi:hypothetical protein
VKTDDLISLLSADTEPVPRRQASIQMSMTIAAGLLVALAIMQLRLGMRPNLGQVMLLEPAFWVKVVFALAVAIASFETLQRLARPGVPVRWRWIAIAGPIALVWLIAIATYTAAPISARPEMVWGHTWKLCTSLIVMISLPVLVTAFIALRRQAPTQLARTGACAGAMSGASATAIYALHCPETGLPFIAIWYVLAIGITTAVGALLGPRLLRW